MGQSKKLSGRPPLTEDKRDKKIDVRFTAAEYELVLQLEANLGISKGELIRKRVLLNPEKMLVNSAELLRGLDHVGAEMGRIGNNINQLAHYANILQLKGRLEPAIIAGFNREFEEYLVTQSQIEVLLRQLLRSIGK